MQDSDKILAQLAEVLAERPRVLLLPLILSHTSFAQTVENLFALAFLVSSTAASCCLASCDCASSCACCRCETQRWRCQTPQKAQWSS